MKNRFFSLDVFRGATVAFMILVNNPGSWGHLYPPVAHATWHGATPTDMVFPFFLFAVGNALAFVIPRIREQGESVFWKKILKRTLLIFLIGLFLNWSPFITWNGENLVGKPWFNEETGRGIRIFGVLQRIAFAYFFGAILCYYLPLKKLIPISAIILLLYWWISASFGNAPGPYTLEGFWGTALDRKLLTPAHLYQGEGVPFDPEGLAGIISSAIQVAIGYMAGWLIKNPLALTTIGKLQPGSLRNTLLYFVAIGFFLIGISLLWSLWFPINKKIWTSTFVLYTSGWAFWVISLVMYLVEELKFKGMVTSFFDAFGKNPLFIFVLSGFLPRVLALFRWQTGLENGKPVYTSILPWFAKNVCLPISNDPRLGSLVYAIIIVFFYWAIAWYLKKKKIFIKV